MRAKHVINRIQDPVRRERLTKLLGKTHGTKRQNFSINLYKREFDIPLCRYPLSEFSWHYNDPSAITTH